MEQQTLKLIDHFLAKNQIDKEALSLIDFCKASQLNSEGENFTTTILYHLLTPKYKDVLEQSQELIREQILEHNYDFNNFFSDPEFESKLKILQDLNLPFTLTFQSVFSKDFKPEYMALYKEEFPENFFMHHLNYYMKHLVRYQHLSLETFCANPQNKVNLKNLFTPKDNLKIQVLKYQECLTRVIEKHLYETKWLKKFWEILDKQEIWKYLNEQDQIHSFLLSPRLNKKKADFIKRSFVNYFLEKDQEKIHSFFLILNMPPKEIFKMKRLPDPEKTAKYVFEKPYPQELVNKYKEGLSLYVFLKIPFQVSIEYRAELINCMQKTMPEADLSFYNTKHAYPTGNALDSIVESAILNMSNKNQKVKSRLGL